MTWGNDKRLRTFLLNIAHNVSYSDHDPREGVELPAWPVLDGALPQVPGVRLNRRVGDDLGPHSIGETDPPKNPHQSQICKGDILNYFFRRPFSFFYCPLLMGFCENFCEFFQIESGPCFSSHSMRTSRKGRVLLQGGDSIVGSPLGRTPRSGLGSILDTVSKDTILSSILSLIHFQPIFY